jgi:hypothetical protein
MKCDQASLSRGACPERSEGSARDRGTYWNAPEARVCRDGMGTGWAPVTMPKIVAVVTDWTCEEWAETESPIMSRVDALHNRVIGPSGRARLN